MKTSYKISSWLLLLIVFTTSAQKLTLMTYNIRLDVALDGENDWTHRRDFFCGQMQFYEPDVFGIQEARPNQVADINNCLTQYASIGIGREGEGQGESSNIYYKKNRFKLLQSSTFWLSETPDQISKGWDAAFNRVCTYGQFEDLQNHQKIWVFNTHLDHMGELARTKGIELILKKISELNQNHQPVIFMGDFNSEPDAPRIISLKKVMDDAREMSLQKPFGPSGTFNNFRHDLPVNTLIDYIFLSKNNKFQVQKYAVLSDAINLKYPSDHLPVYVELNLR